MLRRGWEQGSDAQPGSRSKLHAGLAQSYASNLDCSLAAGYGCEATDIDMQTQDYGVHSDMTSSGSIMVQAPCSPGIVSATSSHPSTNQRKFCAGAAERCG